MTAERERSVVGAAPKGLFIAGKWRDGGGGKTISVEDPSTGETLCDVADATPADATAALDALAGEAARRGWTSGRCAQRDHRLVRFDGHETAVRGPALAQGLVHRLDTGRQKAHGAGLPAPAANVDGARGQCAVPRLRRRR